eukprot:GHVP01064982.1.p1 GENE.GHVP01064982.1~~GHVP01064982.1.p1  ORF type:complete len:320 (-),score=49.68 GHVP01064982.1:973-1932(-)
MSRLGKKIFTIYGKQKISQFDNFPALPLGFELSPTLWLFLMFKMPHKEERFLYPVYPSLLLFAAYGIHEVWSFVRFHTRDKSLFSIWIRFMSGMTIFSHLFISTLICLSRLAATYIRLGLPVLTIWSAFKEELLDKQSETSIPGYFLPEDVTVCLGRSWHRFPGSTFSLPAKLNFVRSDFGGLLPGSFVSTDTADLGMNKYNMHEPSRYSPMEECSYLVDDCDDKGSCPSKEILSFASKYLQFDKIICTDILVGESSPSIFRSLFIPGIPTSSHLEKKFNDKISNFLRWDAGDHFPALKSQPQNVFTKYCLFKVQHITY